MRRTAQLVASIPIALLLIACDPDSTRPIAREEPKSGVDGAGAAGASKPSPVPQSIDALPVPTAKPSIISRKDFTNEGRPGCAFEIRYPGAVDQLAVWSGEGCESIHAQFVSAATLDSLGQLAGLQDEIRNEIAGMGGVVFYVEGQYASAIFPLNSGGRVYRAYLAD
jgi:hypothetical protein